MTIALADTPRLETERLILRAPRGADAAPWADMARTTRARFIGGPFSEMQAWRAWGHVIGHWCMYGCGSFVVERKSDRRAIGHVGPWTPKGWPERELGWVIWEPSAEGKGFAREAATAARRYAYEALGWSGAVSYIDEGNSRSEALAHRLGCTLDPAAPTPEYDDTPPVLVYRHPAPEALQ